MTVGAGSGGTLGGGGDAGSGRAGGGPGDRGDEGGFRGSQGREPADVAVSLARPRAGERVLDLSGRAGALALRIAPGASSVEAVQPDEGLAEEGRRLAATLDRDNVYFHAGSLPDLPFDAGQFDLVVWSMGLSREVRPIATLVEIRRLLASGGRLVLQDVVAFQRARIDLRVWELERRRHGDHLLFYTEEQIDLLLEEAQLEPRERVRTPLTLDFDYWADSATLAADERDAVKQIFFNLPLEDQDRLDLALADGRISFSYPVLTLRVEV